MEYQSFFNELGKAVISIGGSILTVLAVFFYRILKNYAIKKANVLESQGEGFARDVFSKFSGEAYNAVEALAKNGLLEGTKQDAFDKIFKDNFPNADKDLINLYRESAWAKANEDKLKPNKNMYGATGLQAPTEVKKDTVTENADNTSVTEPVPELVKEEKPEQEVTSDIK